MAAASVVSVCAQGMIPSAFETLTVSSTALPITATIVTTTPTTAGVVDVKRAARGALVTVATDAVRVRFDATAPTAAVGHLIAAGDMLWIEGHEAIKSLRLIRVTTDATVSVTLFR